MSALFPDAIYTPGRPTLYPVRFADGDVLWTTAEECVRLRRMGLNAGATSFARDPADQMLGALHALRQRMREAGRW